MSKVLIVDDDSPIRELIGLVVGQFLNCQYDIADNRFQIKTNMLKSDYKLIIVSIHRDGINDKKEISWLKELSQKTAVIAITNSIDRDFKTSVLDSGAHQILNKPFSIRQIITLAAQFV